MSTQLNDLRKGANMSNKFFGITSIGNGGDGFRVEGNANIEVHGLHTEGNAGNGVTVLELAPFMRQFGLPPETDPTALASLLMELQALTKEARESKLKEPGLLSKLWKSSVDGSTLISNLLILSSHPSLTAIIQKLCGGA
jgi:hypothetical protein